jgi:hypothetical protein
MGFEGQINQIRQRLRRREHFSAQVFIAPERLTFRRLSLRFQRISEE